MVSEPGNTSPPPGYGASRPVPPTKPTVRIHQGGGVDGGGGEGGVPLRVHWMHTLQRMMGECVVSPEGKLCDSVLRRSQKLKTQSPPQILRMVWCEGAGPGTIYGRGHMNHMSTGSL